MNIMIYLILLNKNILIWNIIKTDQKWMYLAELALRFQVTGCSEASCERTISAQRLIYTDRRLNSSQELLESRLQMIATK